MRDYLGKRVIIAVGSSGGHFFPALRIAQYLRENYGIESTLLGPMKEELQTILKTEKVPFVNLKISAEQTNIIAIISFYYLPMLKAIFKSFLFLCHKRPKLVIGTGSFGSFPGCISACLLRIPIFIHEQNTIPGMANNFLGKFARKVFLAFPNSSSRSSKTHVVGNPIERQKIDLDKKACYEKFNLDMQKKTLLIFGGSQGAFSLNSWFMDLLEEIRDLKDWQILHIAGRKDYERIKERYANFKIRSYVLPFLYPIDCAYRISDLAISRAGALSLSELSFWGIPALIAPYSYSKDNHQEHNARYFQERGGAYLLKPEEMRDDKFLGNFKELLNDSYKLKLMGEKMKKTLPEDALEKVCEEIHNYIN
jgi:UDP-N-acetylglucosamine--N-acetylmuramyl-(pentapeptide) pyrophosphoryl-undecaprenol N-acetylglucosamine transferase